MRRTFAALLTVIAFFSTLAFVWSGLAKEKATHPRAVPAPTATPSATEASAASVERGPTRDLLVYGDESGVPPATTDTARPGAAAVGTSSATVPTPEATPAPRARLVGFVHTAAGVSAVLALDGAVEVARVREERRGYRVLAFDEEAGTARVQTPEGEELELREEPTVAAPEGDAPAAP